MNANLLRIGFLVLASILSLAATAVRVMPCLEEARLAAVSDALAHLKAAAAADPKVYEDRIPEGFSRAGNRIIYEFFLLSYDDYRGGIWPARDHYQVVVLFDRKAAKPELTCRVQKAEKVAVTY